MVRIGVGSGRVWGKVWWHAAASNKSSSDFIAICRPETPLTYAPLECLPIIDNMHGLPSGQEVIDVELSAGSWQLRYYARTQYHQESGVGRNAAAFASNMSSQESAAQQSGVPPNTPPFTLQATISALQPFPSITISALLPFYTNFGATVLQFRRYCPALL